MDCGVATCAMIAKVNHRTAWRTLGWGEMKRGLRVNEFMGLCASLGVPVTVYMPKRPYPRLMDVGATMKPNVVGLILRRPNMQFGHYVGWWNGKVYDPELGKHPHDQYQRRRWLVVRVFRTVG